MKTVKFIGFIFIIAILVTAGYRWFWHTDRPYNLVVITIDTLRADHLGCYGYADARTPNIDMLAQEGVLCDQVYVQFPLTLPSHVSIFTGTNPTFHQIRDNNWFRLGPRIPTLASILQTYGYRTAAIVSAATLSREKGLSAGFHEYDDVPPQTERLQYIPERQAGESVTIAIEQLQRFLRTPQTPFFLWLHLFDPHAEYIPPQPFRDAFRHNLYDGEVAYTDHELGRFLQVLKSSSQARHTLVVLTADHGEGLGEHGEASHGYFLYKSTLHIPWILHAPGLLPGPHRVTVPLRSIDIMPTVLTLLKIRNHGLAQGVDAAELATGSRQAQSWPKDVPLYAETYFPYYAFGWRVMRCIGDGYSKYIDTRRGEFYRLTTDAQEQHNLLAGNPTPEDGQHADRWRQQLAAFIQNTRSSFVPDFGEGETLATLGYHSYPTQPISYGQANPDMESGPDPSERVAVLQKFVQAQSWLWLQQDDKAIALFQQILTEDPQNMTSLALLGKLYTRGNRLEDAFECFRRLYRMRPELKVPREAMLDILLQQKKWDAAEQLLAEILPKDNQDAMVMSRLAYLRLMKNQYQEAANWAKRATLLNANLPSAWFYLGMSAKSQQKWGEAASAFGRAIQIQRQWPEAHYHYGVCLAQTGQSAQAKQALTTALAQSPPEHLQEEIARRLRQIEEKN